MIVSCVNQNKIKLLDDSKFVVFSPKFSLVVTGMALDFLIKEIDAWPRETFRPRGKSLKFLLGGIFWSLKLQMKMKKK